MFDLIINKDIDALVFYVTVRIGITLVCWIFAVCACLIDFWSGTNTAKILGEKLWSNGFRRTIVKVGDYCRVMLFALMFDILGAFFSFYVLPFATFLVALAVILIEARSVQENNKRKKAHAAEIPDIVSKIVSAASDEQGREVLKQIKKMIDNKSKRK